MLRFTRSLSISRFPLFYLNAKFASEKEKEPKKLIYKGNNRNANEVLKKNEPFSKKLFHEYLKHVPKPDHGKAKLNKKIFYKAVNDAKTPEDIEYINTVICDFLGNCCYLKGRDLDLYLTKSVELKCPEKTLPLLNNHRMFLYYPKPKIIYKILKNYIDNNDIVKAKEFYKAISRKYYIQKSSDFYNKYLKFCFQNNDHEEIVESFLDIIDYENTPLSEKTYNIVLYSNKNLQKDNVFVRILERTINYHKIEKDLGLIVGLLSYYVSQNNKENSIKLLKELEEFNIKKAKVQVFPNEIVKTLLENSVKNVEDEVCSRFKLVYRI